MVNGTREMMLGVADVCTIGLEDDLRVRTRGTVLKRFRAVKRRAENCAKEIIRMCYQSRGGQRADRGRNIPLAMEDIMVVSCRETDQSQRSKSDFRPLGFFKRARDKRELKKLVMSTQRRD